MNQTMLRGSFEEVVLPHLDAAFNYARWLTKGAADADDVVRDAYVRALASSRRLRDGRAQAVRRNAKRARTFPDKQSRVASPSSVPSAFERTGRAALADRTSLGSSATCLVSWREGVGARP